jgi:hypothetical protein
VDAGRKISALREANHLAKSAAGPSRSRPTRAIVGGGAVTHNTNRRITGPGPFRFDLRQPAISGDRLIQVRKRDVLAVVHGGVVIIELFVVVIDAGLLELTFERSGPVHEGVLVFGPTIDVQAVE